MNMTLSIDNFVVLYFLKPYKAARPFTTSNDSEEHFRRPEINLNPHCPLSLFYPFLRSH